jgi:hypothetical protein
MTKPDRNGKLSEPKLRLCLARRYKGSQPCEDFGQPFPQRFSALELKALPVNDRENAVYLTGAFLLVF